MGYRSRACNELRARLCSEIGTRTRACKTAAEQSAKFDPDRCVAMLGKFGEVKQKLANAYQPLRFSAENVAKLQNAERPERGPKDGKLQLIEFLDYEDYGSAQGVAALRVLADKYGDQLRITIRMFPLEAHTNARLAADAALAAHDQGKFWQMHDVLLANQKALDRASLERYAKQLQLDLKAFKNALDKHTHAPTVDADLALVNELKITAMPAMIMNGERMLDGTDPQTLLDAAEEFLAVPAPKN